MKRICVFLSIGLLFGATIWLSQAKGSGNLPQNQSNIAEESAHLDVSVPVTTRTIGFNPDERIVQLESLKAAKSRRLSRMESK